MSVVAVQEHGGRRALGMRGWARREPRCTHAVSVARLGALPQACSGRAWANGLTVLLGQPFLHHTCSPLPPANMPSPSPATPGRRRHAGVVCLPCMLRPAAAAVAAFCRCLLKRPRCLGAALPAVWPCRRAMVFLAFPVFCAASVVLKGLVIFKRGHIADKVVGMRTQGGLVKREGEGLGFLKGSGGRRDEGRGTGVHSRAKGWGAGTRRSWSQCCIEWVRQ